MSLDSRQINMAMQRQIRLRNRIVNSGYVSAASSTGTLPSGTAPQAPGEASSANTSASNAPGPSSAF